MSPAARLARPAMAIGTNRRRPSHRGKAAIDGWPYLSEPPAAKPGVCRLPHVSKKSLKVLQIVSGRDLNGALTYCQFLTEQLIQLGHQVSIACRHDCWLRRQNLPGVTFLESNLNRKPAEVRRIGRWIREQKIDLLHTHMSRAHLFGILLRMTTGIPVIATAHSCNFQPHWRLNDFVIANSESTLSYHRWVNWVSAKRSARVYCFTDLHRFRDVDPSLIRSTRQKLGVATEDFLIGVVGQVAHRKGQRYLFESLPRLTAQIPNLKLAVLGPYYDESPYVRQLRAFLHRHQLEDKVIWIGPQTNVEVYMHAFDLCVVPSLKEPLGLVAVEALASATPVVASQTGGLPEIIEHQRTGLLVPRGNATAIEDAVMQLHAEPNRAKTMAARGQSVVRQRFDAATLTRQVAAIYERVASRGRSAKAQSSQFATENVV